MQLLDKIYNGIYLDVLCPPQPNVPPRPALFLDRDGVILELVDYLRRPVDVRIIDGVAAAITMFNHREIPVAIVTNQSGIARGLLTWDDFEATQVEMLRQLAAAGANIDAVAACPFHADGQHPYAHPDHPCRKPNPGMARLTGDCLRLDLSRSWIVGDHLADVELALRCPLAGAVHVATGHGGQYRFEAASLRDAGHSIVLADSFPLAAAELMAQLNGPSKPARRM